ncbi:hypothetical protein GCM10029978_047130 [Actinoallomurus acanthiterrae]
MIRLAVDVGHPVTAKSLMDALWPEVAPVNPAAALQSLVWRLRQALPNGRSCDPGVVGISLIYHRMRWTSVCSSDWPAEAGGRYGRGTPSWRGVG